MSISVLLASDHPIIRNGLRVLLDREEDIRVVAEAANGREVVMLAEYRRPDVVLLDVALAHVNGITVAREIGAKRREIGIVFVTALTEEAYINEAFKAGARGYVSADAAPVDMIRAIRAVVDGYEFVSPSITRKLLEQCQLNHPDLSEYSRRVLSLYAAANTGDEIAAQLHSDPSRVGAQASASISMLQRSGSMQVILNAIESNRRRADTASHPMAAAEGLDG